MKKHLVILVIAMNLITACSLISSRDKTSEAETPLPPSVTSPPLTETQTPSPTETQTALPPSLTPTEISYPGMVYIPAGPFQMGGDADTALAECEQLYIGGDCQRDWYTDEGRVHTVTLAEYYIDQYEVTNARYAECVAAGACEPPSETGSYTSSSYYGDSQYDDYPVIYVSWNDANTYCAWRGARLPTEAEWEKAARGGLEGKNYPWGDDFDGKRANFCESNCEFDWANNAYDDGYKDTAPVGSYEPNGYDLYDMAGNVWEWVSSLYRDYPYQPGDGREDLTADGGRALRGGSWDSNGNSLRVASRNRNDPSDAYLLIGFRCALSP
ncbi:MAG: formylglycine-generating enzyme family protein [Chloroflexi bacterium]|nr:formylglycine-generating enzyme family protein [Chloroflexota bacterium]